MKKTSVYLTEEESDGLRRLAVSTGRSQAELIREGLHRMLHEIGSRPRSFASLGKGRGGGRPYASWDADELYEDVTGGR
jgi:Arc/MetJ-type ribon-helix-helix transcriptional regulator